MIDTFTCHWLNRLDQFGTTNIVLKVVHDQGTIPDQRLSKKFMCDSDYLSIDDTFLAAAALKEVDQIVTDWNIANPL